MDGLQGAILSVKLKYLERWNNERKRKAVIYNNLLTGVQDVMTLKEASYNKHVYHIYAIRIKNRDEVIASLKEREIYCGIHYPQSIHLQKAYNYLGLQEGFLPVAEMCAHQAISLPMFPELSKTQIEYTVSAILDCLEIPAI